MMKVLLESSSNNRPEYMYDTLDGEGQQDKLDIAEKILPNDDSELPQELGDNKSLDFADADFSKLKPIPTKDIATMENEVSKVSLEQNQSKRRSSFLKTGLSVHVQRHFFKNLTHTIFFCKYVNWIGQKNNTLTKSRQKQHIRMKKVNTLQSYKIP